MSIEEGLLLDEKYIAEYRALFGKGKEKVKYPKVGDVYGVSHKALNQHLGYFEYVQVLRFAKKKELW
jgi:hypothetical protein